jgi:hypothetical protein
MGRLLPLFPLQLVVFPGSAIPLHIFEERYREMVGEAEAAGTEFGIVLAREGGIVNTGCTVLVENILKRYPDGRFDVLTRGRRRFLISTLDREKACLRGDVEFFNDDDPGPAPLELRGEAIQACQRIVSGISGIEFTTPETDDPLLSFRLAEVVDDLDFRNILQRSRSEAERLRSLVDFTEEYVARSQYAAKMKQAAPLNGFGHKPEIQ